MSIFGNIMSAIFGSKPANASPAPGAPGAAPGGTAPAGGAASSSGSAGGGAAASSASAGGASGQKVDVAAVLDKAVKDKGEKLNWKTSIVDLMKALDLDSSLSARKELAKELHYTGDTDDSATMNIWLHKQVIKKLEENGGKVPADLAD